MLELDLCAIENRLESFEKEHKALLRAPIASWGFFRKMEIFSES